MIYKYITKGSLEEPLVIYIIYIYVEDFYMTS